jgi:two-component system, chemotaxis family, CheB/CheR fusion protein
MAVFHYALTHTGFLMLGNSETAGPYPDLFGMVDKRHRVFQKKAAAIPNVGFAARYGSMVAPLTHRVGIPARDDSRLIQQEADRLIQERYAPPGVVVDGELQIVQFRGQTGQYLEPPPGEPSLNVLKMAREGLLYGLRSILNEVRKGDGPVRKDGLRVRSNGGWREVTVEALPLGTSQKPHYLVLFHHGPDHEAKTVERPGRREKPAGERRSVARLQQELQSNREYLQSIIQELEAANEELQSANEEILSANEELQSTNEELDTAKEELQSTNEELNTVNEQLQGRNDELSLVNSDLLNLLASVQIAIVIVAHDLRIRRFTPMAERALNLIPADVGRPIGHIKPNIDCPDLEELILDVIESVVPREREVRDSQGRWFSLQIRPYKNLENRIDGAVLALFDVDAVRRHADAVRDLCAGIVDSVHEPVVILDLGLRVTAVNAPFEREFGISRAEILGRFLYDFAAGRWSATSLRRLLEDELPGSGQVMDFLLERGVSTDGRRPILVTAHRIVPDVERSAFVVLSMRSADDTG